jgi:TPR repeat protein
MAVGESQYDFQFVTDKLNCKDYVAAVQYVLSYAISGNSDAQSMMGFFYEVGLGVPRDLVEAEWWLLKAAGQDNPVAWNNLGTLYLTMCCNGQCPPEYREKAQQCYRRAKELGFNGAHPYPPPTA